MQHLQIAFDLFVIIIGFASLSVVSFWAIKKKEPHLRDFCILYTLFTLVLVISVLKKYLSLNVRDFPGLSWYFISGIYQVITFAVLVAIFHFILEIYQVKFRKIISIVFLTLTILFVSLMFTPFGAVFDAENERILLGTGFKIASGWYFVGFTLVLAVGYGFIRRVWSTDKKTFVLGLLLFGTIGYAETLLDTTMMLRNPVILMTTENMFLFSSIPYAIYGIFLVVYFLRTPLPLQQVDEELPETFMTNYDITDREREIILKVVQGKSNADIASELYISLATVKTHLHNIYRKIGVDSRYNLLAKVRSGR